MRAIPKFAKLVWILVVAAANAWGTPYGNYDVRQAVNLSTGPAGPQGHKVTIDVGRLNAITNDLAQHAFYYPPKFDNAADQARAAKDAVALAGLMEIIAKAQPTAQFLGPAAVLQVVAYNFNTPASDAKAIALFTKWIAVAPDNARAKLQYGYFLFESTRFRESIPWLEKARAAGEIEAAYWLGVLYLAQGKQREALKYWDDFVAHSPDGKKIAKEVEALRKGELRVVRSARHVAPAL